VKSVRRCGVIFGKSSPEGVEWGFAKESFFRLNSCLLNECTGLKATIEIQTAGSTDNHFTQADLSGLKRAFSPPVGVGA
jgi:hypothetical protein